MDKISLGDFIRKRRKQLNISLNDLSNSLDISFQAVHKWEKGESFPDFIILGDLCNILQISIDDLLSLSYSNDYISNQTFNPDTFGKTLKNYQKNRNLSQKDLAKLTNINQSTISNIINQKGYPTIEQFIRLCDVFNISYSTLYYSKFIPLIKEEKQRKKIPLKLVFTLCFTVLIAIIIVISKPKQTPKITPTTHYIVEYWDEFDNLIETQTIPVGSSLTNSPYCPTSAGWNKRLETPTSSTIIKANKENFNIKLYVHTSQGSYTHYYDNKEEFSVFDIQSATHYCNELRYQNGEVFDINNLKENSVTLYADLLPKSSHTIFFPSEFNLDVITVKDAEKLHFMPMVATNNFIIKDWETNGLLIDPTKPYSFEKSITAMPIYINQETKIDNNGYITYLNSKDKSIIIPDYINDIKVKGIKSNSIILNENNEEIIFLNKSPISFEDVFYDDSLINNIKNISITYDSFTPNSYLGNITNLDNLTISSGDQNINSYEIKNLSSSSLHINNLKYYYRAHAIARFNDLNVDNVYCLDKGFTHVVEHMFENSTIKNFYYSISLDEFSIHESAFKNCKNLTSFTFHKNTFLYGNNQFYGCDNLSNVSFLGKINTLSNNMFYGTNIESLTINNPVNSISNQAFNNTILKSIELVNVNNIEENIYLPTTLKDLYVGGIYEPLKLTKKDLTVHYLDYDNNFYEVFKTKNHEICLNCLCLHKGEYK